MVPWRDVNIEAPIARAFLDRGLTGGLAHHYTGRAGRPDQRDAGDAPRADHACSIRWPTTDCCRRKFFAAIHPKFRTPWKNTILVGLLAAIVGSVTPIDDIGKMVNIGTLLAFVIVCCAVMVLRRTDPDAAASVPHAVGAAGADHGRAV